MTELGAVRAGVVLVLVVVGSFFLLVGTVGLLRLPNVYNRMHATSKATTLGAASLFLAGTAYFGPQGAGLTSLVGIAFLFATAPTGAHVISRAAQKMGIDFEPGVTWPLDQRVGTTREPTSPDRRESPSEAAEEDADGSEDVSDGTEDVNDGADPTSDDTDDVTEDSDAPTDDTDDVTDESNDGADGTDDPTGGSE